MKPVKGISGTLVPAVLGLSPFKSPLQAYLNIFGLEEEPESEAITWGIRLEPLIAQEYQKRTGAILWPNTDFGLGYHDPLRHREHDWWTGTPDRLIIDDPKYLIDPELYYTDRENAREAIEKCVADPAFWRQVIMGWEAKTAGPRTAALWGEEETDEIPETYLIQCSWYLGLVKSYNPEVEVWAVSVLLGGQQFRTYQVRYNDKLVKAMAAKAEAFWHNHVLTRTPPPPSPDPAWQQYFRQFLPRETQPLEPASDAEEMLFHSLWEAHKNLKRAEAEYEAAVNALKLAIGEREGIYGNGWKITWKKSKDRIETDWKQAYFDLCAYCYEKGLSINDEEFSGKHITIKPGPRVFRPTWPKED